MRACERRKDKIDLKKKERKYEREW
jgi:hypothetical protein